MKLWKRCNDRLPERSANNIPENLQGIVLKSQFYGRAIDLVKKLSPDEIEADNGALNVASAIFKQYVLSIVTDTFHRFLDVLRTRQGEGETYNNFETRFDAQICKLNATCEVSELPSALVDFLLLANSKIGASQRVSILSAAAPIGSMKDVSDRDGKEVLYMISYGDIASVVRACDEPKKSLQSDVREIQSMGSFNSRAGSSDSKGGKKKRLTPDELSDLKSNSTCRVCNEKGHWSTNVDKCKLAQSTQSRPGNPPSGRGSKPEISPVSPHGTIKFNMAVLSPNDTISYMPGLLVDDGAPYGGIRIVELRTLAPDLLPAWDGKLQPLPGKCRCTPSWQYGSGGHASPKRRILGSIVLSVLSYQNVPVEIRHLVMKGSSQWFISRNVTRSVISTIWTGTDSRFVHFPWENLTQSPW